MHEAQIWHPTRLDPDVPVEEAIPPSAVAGTRYDAHQLKMLDSER